MSVHELTKCVTKVPNRSLGLNAGPNESRRVTHDDVACLRGTRLHGAAAPIHIFEEPAVSWMASTAGAPPDPALRHLLGSLLIPMPTRQ
jgi:hypothetical protein